MSDRKDGGPAFPDSEGQADYTGGMTLRDYFAAKAMQALISTVQGSCLDGIDGRERAVARNAYLIAGALLSEREGGEQ